ncbi:hypothetical protein D3C85_1733020 [compost metagenome]
MGILLTFMFLWNMLGALVLIPALSHYLLNPKGNSKEGLTLDLEDARAQQESRKPAADTPHHALTEFALPRRAR